MKCTFAISDLHAGAIESLLTPVGADATGQPERTTEVTQTFATALSALIAALGLDAPPGLVLLGDIYDFSLADPETSGTVAEGFLREVLSQQPVSSVAYLPGNHDHVLWTAARFDGADWAHVSKAFGSPDRKTARLERALQAVGYAGSVATAYPNLGVLSQGTTPARALVFHHGHFIESAYSLMSRLAAALARTKEPPLTVDRLERENGAWIDFVWSTLGDSGALGQQMDLGERLMVTGGAAHGELERLAELMAGTMADRLPLPHSAMVEGWLSVLSRALLDGTLGSYGQLERYGYEASLSPASIAGLTAYLQGAVLSQMTDELHGRLPDQTTFVFGHTHKPFADRLVVPGFAQPVAVYNTGGWVLDTDSLSTVEGAALVFHDEDLNTAMLQLYKMGDDTSLHGPQVVALPTSPGTDNPMATALRSALNATGAQWAAFTQAVDAGLQERQDLYLSAAADVAQAKTGDIEVEGVSLWP